MITAETRPDAASFNDAIREAVTCRDRWAKPVNIWMFRDGMEIGFEARANTVPPGDPSDEVLLTLTEDGLADLAETLNDPSAFNAMVTEMLSDSINRYGLA
jgi:hypothetical protein